MNYTHNVIYCIVMEERVHLAGRCCCQNSRLKHPAKWVARTSKRAVAVIDEEQKHIQGPRAQVIIDDLGFDNGGHGEDAKGVDASGRTGILVGLAPGAVE